MYYIYIIQSLKCKEKLYVGYTSDLQNRIRLHKLGKTYSTRKLLPIKLVYYEAYKSKTDAKRRERMLKQYGASLAHLKKRISSSLS
jgi:putative endonuclease